MDIQKALSELYEEKKRLDWTISTLEARLKISPSRSRSRRGRKSMGDDERLKVSERMSAYWAGRRAAKRMAHSTSLQSAAVAVEDTLPVFEQTETIAPAQPAPPQSVLVQSVPSQVSEDTRLSA
jgi:hypothetical protein